MVKDNYKCSHKVQPLLATYNTRIEKNYVFSFSCANNASALLYASAFIFSYSSLDIFSFTISLKNLSILNYIF